MFNDNIIFSKTAEINERTETAEIYEQTCDVRFKKNFVNSSTNKTFIDWTKTR